MTLQDIKNKLDIEKLELRFTEDENGEKTPWLRHWDNENRNAIVIHNDLAEELKKNPNMTNLGLKKEVRSTDKGEYTNYVIIKYDPADVIL